MTWNIPTKYMIIDTLLGTVHISASILPNRRSISATNAHFSYLAKGRLETRSRTLLPVYTACKFRSRGRELSMCLMRVNIRSIKYNMGCFILGGTVRNKQEFEYKLGMQ